MTQFPIHFRDHVTPRLRREIAMRGTLVSIGTDTFTDAYDAVMALARVRGCLHLPEDKLNDLEDWIATTLLQEITDADARRQEPRLLRAA